MAKNNTIEEIGEELSAAGSVLIFPHILMDGDALGSAAALCRALRSRGKTAYIVTEDKTADYLLFLQGDYCRNVADMDMTPDISLCIDCGEEKRFPKRKELLRSGRKTICIDHHKTSEGIADLNYIDGGAAATGEIVYEVIKSMGIAIDGEMAEAIFAAIATDTGNFMYSNTDRKSHEIVIELMDAGLDCNKVSIALYENESLKKIRLHSSVMCGLELFSNGEGAAACVTQQMLKDSGAAMEDTEGLVGMMRSIKGVQIALLFKENSPQDIKVAMRAKTKGDVAAIALKHGGGGHVKAAGCTIHDSIDNAKKLMIREAEEALNA